MSVARAFAARALLPAIAVYIGLALVSGFDRAAAAHPELARWVPAPFAAQAPASAARRFVTSGLAAPALEPARQALAADPLDPGAAGLLGTALLARGQGEAADRAFRHSARLGWREPLTQSYWLELALQRGDIARAVVRFDALARQYSGAPAVTAAADRIEASPAGRAALSARIARGTGWALGYAAVTPADPPERLARRGEVLLGAARLGRRLGCEASAGLAAALAPHDPMLGAALWREHCPDASRAGALSDPDFAARRARPRVPYEWDIAADGALEAQFRRVEGFSGGEALQLRSTAPSGLRVLSQLVPLTPGRYRLTWLARPQTGRLRAALTCTRDAAMPAPDGVEIVVDASCPARWLQFWLTPGSEPVLLGQVRLERL